MQRTTVVSPNPQNWEIRYGNYLRRVALSRISDPDKASDLVQDTFLAGLERLKNFKGASTERTWLTSILLHKIIDCYRKKASENSKQLHVIKSVTEQLTATSTDDKIGHKEFACSLDLILLKLPGLWAEAFKMKYLDELSTDKICSQLGITPSNFWTITHRSKLRLRGYLQKAG